ncbi:MULTISPECIES: NAD(P)/FAD-dependent oxidoreductase [Holospora]|uniref:Ferredoxin--NADP reductase n=2 Tax=Holospora TaxID=44747 RepID=A0A061JGF9_9PROT|nr:MULTISPECIES: NAD(P)/FAD-dependent oxidoreductase [Holospora]ETZ05136.1 ferredoxin--NADP reductase [Holospora undulata HU1]GAJ46002.1 ferredoxin--NADP reductase [Holospora elegans E1]
MKPFHYDVIIIGAGPVGLFSVFACGMVGLRVGLFDALSALGGQCSALYAKKPIYDIPGHPSLLAGELIDRLIKQMAPFNPGIFLQTPISTLEKDLEKGWSVTTSCEKIKGRVILICTGAGAFTPKRPAIPFIENFEHQNVLYCVDHPDRFSGKRVVIAGGGDSAVDWSLLLSQKGAQVFLVHRRNKFRAQEASLARLDSYISEGKIKLFAPCQVIGLEGNNGKLQKIHLQHAFDQTQWVDCDFFIPCFGLEIQKSPFETWGIQLNSGMIVTCPSTGQTSVSGIYAAGDCVTYPEKLKLIMTGFSEAMQAAHHLRKTHFSERSYRFEHSTSTGVPSPESKS